MGLAGGGHGRHLRDDRYRCPGGLPDRRLASQAVLGGILLFLLSTSLLTKNFRWFLGCALGSAIVLFAALTSAVNRYGERFGLYQQFFQYPGEISSAERLEDFHKARPDDPYGGFLLGLSRHMQGRISDAMFLYKEAGEEPDALNNLGILQAEAGDAAPARASFERAASLGSAAARYNLFKIGGNQAEFDQAKALEPTLVKIQKQFMNDRWMFSPMDSEKVDRLTRSSHRDLWIKAFL